MTITGLKPETTYAVRLSAVNGKGVGELSLPAEFKTQPVRKCSPAPSAPPSCNLPCMGLTFSLSQTSLRPLFSPWFGLEWVFSVIQGLL